MKVITIKQPFATLIAEGLKRYEFRTWKTNYRGEIWIHAGKSIDKKAMKKFEKYHLEYPTGCILAKADLVDCVEIKEEERALLRKKNSLVYSGVVEHPEWKGYGFHLENVQKVSPIFVKGKLGLWNLEK